jgi:hypothetical protein
MANPKYRTATSEEKPEQNLYSSIRKLRTIVLSHHTTRRYRQAPSHQFPPRGRCDYGHRGDVNPNQQRPHCRSSLQRVKPLLGRVAGMSVVNGNVLPAR